MRNILNEIEAGDPGGCSSSELLAALEALAPCDRARYRMVALVAITLRPKVGSLAKAKAEIINRGISLATWKNAMHLICVYDDVVEPGHAEMRWFLTVNFQRARMLKRVMATKGVGWLKRSGTLGGATRDWAALQRIAEE